MFRKLILALALVGGFALTPAARAQDWTNYDAWNARLQRHYANMARRGKSAMEIQLEQERQFYRWQRGTFLTAPGGPNFLPAYQPVNVYYFYQSYYYGNPYYGQP